jgi:hypothetical protein
MCNIPLVSWIATGTVKLIYMPEVVAFEDLSMRLLSRDGWDQAA